MKKMICVVLCLLSVAMLSGCGDTNTSLRNGQEITLSSNTPVASSKANVDKIINYVNANNESGLREMESMGDAEVLSAGTKVTIVKVGVVTEIETQYGAQYFAPIEVLE